MAWLYKCSSLPMLFAHYLKLKTNLLGFLYFFLSFVPSPLVPSYRRSVVRSCFRTFVPQSPRRKPCVSTAWTVHYSKLTTRPSSPLPTLFVISRYLNIKGGSFIPFGFIGNGASLVLDDLLGNGQSHTHTTRFCSKAGTE